MTKKLHRFLIDQTPGDGTWSITAPELIHQVSHVLKLTPGEECIVFCDGGDDVRVRILSIEKKSISVETLSKEPAPINARTLIAAVALVKGDAFERIVQKLTELGVHAIVPLITDRTIKQSINKERLQTISDEALEQSGGTARVQITEPITLETCLEQFPYQSICFDTEQTETSQTLSEKVIMYIGPEGGWSDTERALFASHNISSLSLGDRVLRADTAAIVGAYELLK